MTMNHLTRIIGASLSEPHTSVAALRTRVYLCLLACLLRPTTYRNERFQIFHDD